MIQPTVLVVDDDADIRTVIGQTLSDEGMLVGTASDGPEALQRVDEALPSLIILDITLPVLDGYQVAEQLRQRFGELPILAITADGRAAEKARRVGAFAYLRKPFELEELVALVKRGLSESMS